MKRRLVSLAVCLFLVTNLFSVFITYSQTPVPEGIIEVEIPVRGTFVRAIDDWPYYGPGQKEYDEYLGVAVGDYTDFHIEDPAIIDLESYGIFEGDTIYIGWSGGVYPDGAWNPADPGSRIMGLRENERVPYGGLLGLFSTSSQLLDIDVLNRVPGAIGFGDGYGTPATLWDNGRSEVSQKLSEKNIDWYNGSLTTDIPEDFFISPHIGMLIEIPRNAKFLFISLIDEYYRDNFEGPNSLIVTIEKDTDEDGIPDPWEQNGIDFDKDGEIDLNLPMLGADWEHKDVFVEIDYLTGSVSNMRPKQEAINDVIAAFANAPVSNPDGVEGINLHVLVDEAIYMEGQGVNEISWTEFFQIKKEHFGTIDEQPNHHTIEAKKQIFRYCLSAFYLESNNKCPGVAEGIVCDDFILTFAALIQHGTPEKQAAIFMHELGHSLGLMHGGGDDINFKPNYLSIMNYAYQFNNWKPERPLDYSREKLLDLDEDILNEALGIGTPSRTVWNTPPPSGLRISDGNYNIDWNIDGNITGIVSVNLNDHPDRHYPSVPGEILSGHNDWENLVYRFRGSTLFSESAIPEDHDELTIDVIELMEEEGKNLVEVSIPEFETVEFSELQVDVSALATFLRADPIMEEGGSPVEEPTIIDLEATGLIDEEWILISYSGKIFHAIDWGDGDPKEDGYINLIGIFSTTSELESIDKLNRVPGAIDSNRDFVTDETYFGELQTDISEDFLSGDHTGTTIEIPDGARFLFLCNPDVYYPDNFGSFQVTIKTLETGQSDSVFPIEIVIIIILAIIAIIILFIVYKRKKGNESKNVTVKNI